MSLRSYRQKRDFTRTSEPSESSAESRPDPARGHFVIQKHASHHLHYDLRLEMDGVLKSWAVPKGVPYKAGDKHLAVEVEDHPRDYADFEGIIAEGNYGAGTVMVWDRGDYECLDTPPRRSLKSGKLRLFLRGSKLTGEWTLVRTSRGNDDKKMQWLLIKTAGSVAEVSAKEDDRSAKTRRSMRTIATEHKAEWVSGKPAAAPRKKSGAQGGRSRRVSVLTSLPEGKAAFTQPMQSRLVNQLPRGADWIYEVKFDGFRALGIKEGKGVRLMSRNELEMADQFPQVVSALSKLPCQSVVLDGEIVATEEDGRFSFQLLQNNRSNRAQIFYYVFDILQLDGKDLRGQMLSERKRILELLLKGVDDRLRVSIGLDADPGQLVEQVRRLGIEGVVAKRSDSLYEAGKRTGSWVKWKAGQGQEFVIGGYTAPRGGRKYFGALVVGFRDGGKWLYASKVGTGFSDAMLKKLYADMQGLVKSECPFANLPVLASGRFGQGLTAREMKKCVWLEPKLVCEVQFSEWTRDGQLRAPSFKGLRLDKKPMEVVRERPVESAEPARGETVAISRESKVLFPDDGITKGDLVDYYKRVGKKMLPYLRGRPISMQRFPNGIGTGGFFQKDIPEHFPKWIKRIPVGKEDGVTTYVICDNLASLVYLANQACITPHAWLSRQDKLDYPDMMVMDLDPPIQDYSHVCQTALLMKSLFEKLGFTPFVKTTGSRGLHVVVPLDRSADFATVREFAHDVALVAVMLDPDRLTVEFSKAHRGNRMFLDTTRNAHGQTIAPAYAVRPEPGAPVSMPLEWDELKNCSNISTRFTLRNAGKRLEKKSDPWAGFFSRARSLNRARVELDTWLKALKAKGSAAASRAA